MIISLILLFIIAVTYLVLGLSVTAFFRKISLLERLSVSFLIGSILFTYLQFMLYAFLNISFTSKNLYVLLAFLLFYSLGSILIGHRFIFNQLYVFLNTAKEKIKELLYGEKILLLALAFVVTSSLFLNFFWPVTDWDAIALYDYRAKVILATSSLERGIQEGYFLQYPLYTSLLHANSYLLSIPWSKPWYSLLYICFLMLFYSLLRKNTTRLLSLLGTVILASTPLLFTHSQVAYTNLPFTIFYVTGLLYLVVWVKDLRHSSLFIGSLLVAGSTWIRLSEPFWICAVLIVLLGLIRNKGKHVYLSILSILLIFFLRTPWLSFISQKTGETTSTAISTFGTLRNLNQDINNLFNNSVEVMAFLYKNVLPVFKFHLLPLLLVLTMAILVKNSPLKVPIIPLVATLLTFGIIALGTLIFSFTYPGWQSIPDSAARISMVMIPLILYSSFASFTVIDPKTK